MKLALEEHKVYFENSLLNVSGTSTPPPFGVIKKHPEEHIDFLIKQGKVDVAIDQVTCLDLFAMFVSINY